MTNEILFKIDINFDPSLLIIGILFTSILFLKFKSPAFEIESFVGYEGYGAIT